MGVEAYDCWASGALSDERDDQVRQHLAAPNHNVNWSHIMADADFTEYLFEVLDESMWPRFKQGEYAVVEPWIAPLLNDDVLVRLRNGETLIRRLLSDDSRKVRLGTWGTAGDLVLLPDDIVWMHHVSGFRPADNVKRSLEAMVNAGATIN